MKKILNFLFYTVFIVYSVEILLFIFSSDLQKSLVDIKNKRIEIATKQNINFDSRDPEEVFFEKKKKINDLSVPFYYSALFENYKIFKTTKDRKGIIPFRGPINKKNISCSEDLNYRIINNDKYGFKNLNSIYESNIDVILLGGSFVEGFCYENEKDISGNLIKEKIQALNLGVATTGPLVSLAILKEFGTIFKPKNIFYFYYEANNLDALLWESKEINLINYLNEDYKQNYINRYNEVKTFLDEAEKESFDIISNNLFKKNNTLKKRTTGNVKDILELSIIKNRFRNLIIKKNNLYNMKLFYNIISQMENEVNKWNGNFTFVYIPSWDRYFNKNSNLVPVIKLREKIIQTLKDLNINTIDISETFSNLDNLENYYPLGYIGHLNEKGYKKIADILKKNIAN